jgi:cell division protein FtsI (penicillin-binding protein 3)
VVLTVFAGRLVQIQGMQTGHYRSASQHLQSITLPAVRGTIYGANGQVLALTVETYTVTADPPLIAVVGDSSLKAGGDAAKAQVAQQLAGPLGMPATAVLSLLEHPTSPQYVVLKKGVSLAAQQSIDALKVDGIYTTPVFSRAYPDGAATANVVGFTNVSQSDVIAGQAGIEEQYNRLLAGTPGSEQAESSDFRNGPSIPLAGGDSVPAKDGQSIRLTIVPALQLAAMQACEAQVKKYHARNCTVVIMRPHTGDILAMAQWPTYYQPTLASVEDAVNVPDHDLFAPGSTAKVITAAAALEQGGQTMMSSYYIPYQIYRGGQWIHDAEWSAGEHYTIAGIIANSSNIGMSQVVEHVPEQVQYDYLRAFGLDQPTGLNLPGEETGILLPPSKWPGDLRYTLSFGQGIAVSAVQMASVYATLANGGVRVQPRLVAGTYNVAGQYIPAKPSPSRKVIKATTAHDLIGALQQVPMVDMAADQPWGIFTGYAMAVKTGTAQEPGPNCPLCEWGSSYIGMAPGDNPQVVVAVNVQHPKGQHFGDVVAGPVFYNVMKFALATLQIPPDGAVPPNVRLNAR